MSDNWVVIIGTTVSVDHIVGVFDSPAKARNWALARFHQFQFDIKPIKTGNE